MNLKTIQSMVLFADEDIIVVNKPPGIPSIPDRWQNPENMRTMLLRLYDEVFIVHRIDKDTSGVMLYARNAEAHRKLSMAFEKRKIHKKYWLLVQGNPYRMEDEIDIPLMRVSSGSFYMKPSSRGKKSVTRYKVIENFKPCSLVEAEILTGRTHQIRAHFKAIGHPLLIDEDYGDKKEVLLSEWKGRKYRKGQREERPLMNRLSLHAREITFVHPKSGKELRFEAPLPKDMKAVISQLRKWAPAKA